MSNTLISEPLSAQENLLRAIRSQHPHHVPYYGEPGLQFVDHRLALPPSDGGLDLWGVRWSNKAGEQLPYPVEHPVRTVRDILHYPFPDPHAADLWRVARQAADPTHNLVIGRHICALFERLHTLVGMETAMVALAEEPEAAAAALRRIGDWQLEIAQEYVALGVGGGRISDDYGSQTSLLISPAAWRQVIKPQLARLVRFYKERGLLVFLHSCGHLAAIMDDLVELGIDVFNIQTSANDLPAYKSRYGARFTLMGGVDTQGVMTQGTPAEVRAAAIATMRTLGAGGGLILEPDQRVAMPPENVAALQAAARELGQYDLWNNTDSAQKE